MFINFSGLFLWFPVISQMLSKNCWNQPFPNSWFQGSWLGSIYPSSVALPLDSVGEVVSWSQLVYLPIYFNLEPKWSAPCFCWKFGRMFWGGWSLLHHPLCSEKRTQATWICFSCCLGNSSGKKCSAGPGWGFFLKVRDQRFKGNVSRGISPQVIL